MSRRLLLASLSGIVLPVVTGVAATRLTTLDVKYQFFLMVPVGLAAFLTVYHLDAPQEDLSAGPDITAKKAQSAYGHRHYQEALQLSAMALNALHTQYFVLQCEHRQPSARDSWIVQDLVSAFGICTDTEFMPPDRAAKNHLVGTAETAEHYLLDIARVAQNAGLSPRLYLDAAKDIAQYRRRLD